MILVTRLNGREFALNPDLIERADSTPDTVITLLDGTKYVIAESVSEFVRRVRDHRASVIALAQQIESGEYDDEYDDEHSGITGNVVPLHRRDR